MKILVAVDGSERKATVVREAAKVGLPFGATFVLLRVTGERGDLPLEAYASDEAAIHEVLTVRAQTELEGLAREAGLPSGVVVRVTSDGPAWRAIGDVARAENVDMIVIGAHGYGVVSRMLGTTAARVVDHADRTVLVVR